MGLAALTMQPYPRSPDLVWPGHLHGTGCLSARAVGTGFPTVVRRLCLGPIGGLVWVLLTSPVLAGVLGGSVCGVVPLVSAVGGVRRWASVSACFWDVCGFVGAPLAPCHFRFRRAVWACVLGLGLGSAQPFLAGLSGCVFCAFVFSFVFLFFFPGFVVPVPPSPFFRAGLVDLLFFFSVSVSLFPLGRCYWLGVAGFGWVVPLCLCGGPVFGAFWGGVWPPVVVLAGGLAAVGCFRAFSPSPLLFFGGGGLACSSLCLPWAGARTGLHSVLSFGLLSSVAFCVAAFPPHGSGGLCKRLARRPFLPGLVLALPAGRLHQAGACGFGLGGWGCSCPFPSAVPAVFFWVVRHRCRLARCGPVCGLPCWCVACWRGAFQGVRWLASVSPSG